MTLRLCGRSSPNADHLLALPAAATWIAERNGRIVIAHPLIRQAIIDEMDKSVRREVHRQMATAYRGVDPDRFAYHLGLSAFGPDDTIAEQLESFAPTLREAWGPA